MNYSRKSSNVARSSSLLSTVLIFGALMLSSCDKLLLTSSDKRVVARAHNSYLYSSDLETIVPKNISPADSIVFVNNFINNWIRRQLLLHEAEETLLPAQKDFKQQLENYRNSLLIFEYESMIVEQKLDTVVSMQEIMRYYEQNKANFELKENIVRVNYMQIELNSSDLNRLRRQWQILGPNEKQAIERYSIENGLRLRLDSDSWLHFNDLTKEIPIRTYNQEEFLSRNRDIEVYDSLYIYFVRFHDFRIKESVAPLSIQEDKIRKIIINRRRLDIIQNTQDLIFNKGLKNNYFEIY